VADAVSGALDDTVKTLRSFARGRGLQLGVGLVPNDSGTRLLPRSGKFQRGLPPYSTITPLGCSTRTIFSVFEGPGFGIRRSEGVS